MNMNMVQADAVNTGFIFTNCMRKSSIQNAAAYGGEQVTHEKKPKYGVSYYGNFNLFFQEIKGLTPIKAKHYSGSCLFLIPFLQ